MSTRCVVTLTNSALQRRLLAVLRRGAQHQCRPAAASRGSTSHGTVAVIVTGVCEISGAVTLRQLAVLRPVQRRGGLHDRQQRRGTDSTKPIRPAIVATQRATLILRRTSSARSSVDVGESAVMAAP